MKFEEPLKEVVVKKALGPNDFNFDFIKKYWIINLGVAVRVRVGVSKTLKPNTIRVKNFGTCPDMCNLKTTRQPV